MSADFNSAQILITEHYRNNTSLPVSQQCVENDAHRPVNDELWVRLTILHNFSKKITTCEVEDYGIIVLDIFSPLNKGTKGIQDVKTEFASMFEHKNIGGVRCFDLSAQQHGEHDNFYHHSISINYIHTREA